MDKISQLSYLLYQSDNEEIKNIAIQLLNGDVSLKDIKKAMEIISLRNYKEWYGCLDPASPQEDRCFESPIQNFLGK